MFLRVPTGGGVSLGPITMVKGDSEQPHLYYLIGHESYHYYGQYQRLGPLLYFTGIGLPSIINASRSGFGFWAYGQQPWEVHASVAGGRDQPQNVRDLGDSYMQYLERPRRLDEWFDFFFVELPAIINHDFSSFDDSGTDWHTHFRTNQPEPAQAVQSLRCLRCFQAYPQLPCPPLCPSC